MSDQTPKKASKPRRAARKPKTVGRGSEAPQPAGAAEAAETERQVPRRVDANGTSADAQKAKPAAADSPAKVKKPRRIGKPTTAQQPVAAADDASVPEPVPDEQQQSMVSSLLRESPSWLVSLVVHMAILLVLAMLMLPKAVEKKFGELSLSTAEPSEEVEEFPEEEMEEIELDVAELSDVVPEVQTDITAEDLVEPVEDVAQAQIDVELSPVGLETAPQTDLMQQIGAATGTGELSNRSGAARRQLVARGGGNEASERAVALALKWLAAHQRNDGAWSFDHTYGPSKTKPGSQAPMTNAATAMALLPFLAAGHTHKDGEYQRTVYGGLQYLTSKIKVSPQKGGDLTDPGHGMYSHGLAAITLCEAYGMTQDPALRDYAQAAVNFCVTGQDQVTGGWGYHHGSGNDTSVAGWQIMGLKSAKMAYLQVPESAFRKSYAFLDSVQTDGGASYGYRSPSRRPSTSSVGLLCRMYLGWKPDRPALEQGAKRLAAHGPSKNDMYFNYYATQVLYQYTGGKGEMWDKWNTELRDWLILTQEQKGAETGSWTVGRFVSHGGRIYSTSMATMCLEVYYRYMPIFQQTATAEEAFPLE